MNSYNARMLANIVKWIRDNRKNVPFVYDGVNYTLTIRMESIFIERNNEINQGVYLEDRKFNWPDGLLEVIWKEIEKIRLNEIATKLEKMVESSEQKNKELKETLKKRYLECIRHYLKNNNNIKIVIDKVDYSFYLEDDVIVVLDIGADIAIVLEHMSGQFIEIAYRMIGKLDQMAKINFIYEWVMVNGPEVSLRVNVGQERDYRLVRRGGELFIDDGVVENRINYISSVLIDAIFKLLSSYESAHPSINLVKQKGTEKTIINKIYEFWKLHELNIMNRNESFNKINEVSIDDQIRAITCWISARGNSAYAKTDVVTYYIVNSDAATFVNIDGVMFFDIWSVDEYHIKKIYNAIKEMENNSTIKADTGSIDTSTNYKELLVNYLQSVRDEVIELNKLEIYICEESRGTLQEALDLVTELIHVISTNNQKPKKEAIKLVKEKYIDWFTRCKKEIVIGELVYKKFNVDPFTYKTLKELITQNLPGIYGDGNLDRIIEVLEQYNPNDAYKELYEILKG